MKFKTLIAAIVLSLALPVAAEMHALEQAHEVNLSEMRLPVHETGTIAFRAACFNCAHQTLRVNANTRYVLDGHDVTLEKFRKAMARVTERGEQVVTLFQDLEDDLILRVSVYIR